jgi:hypothetical protein
MLFRIFAWNVWIIGRKEVDKMAVIYVALIIKGKRTFESVPDLLKDQVKELLIDLELEALVTD